MSPLEIQIILHYYCLTTDYRDGDFSAPAVRATINNFRDDLGLIEEWPEGERPRGCYQTYRITERGKVFVVALCNTPLPVQTWVMPCPE